MHCVQQTDCVHCIHNIRSYLVSRFSRWYSFLNANNHVMISQKSMLSSYSILQIARMYLRMSLKFRFTASSIAFVCVELVEGD